MSTQHTFPAQAHNHNSCIDQALRKAKQNCKQNGLRFTPIRQKVFKLVWLNHAPIAAYHLLKLLRQEKDNAEATTVYRALDFLLENHLIHKIQSLNAYIGCEHPGNHHVSQFLICTQCQQVSELENQEISQTIEKQTRTLHFNIDHQTIELMGVCESCQP